MHTLKAALPQDPGGILGAVIGGGLTQALGFTGGTLILLMLFAAGLSLFTGISWLSVIEALGTWVEGSYLFALRKWEEREDRRAGEQATIEREEVVEEKQRNRITSYNVCYTKLLRTRAGRRSRASRKPATRTDSIFHGR